MALMMSERGCGAFHNLLLHNLGVHRVVVPRLAEVLHHDATAHAVACMAAPLYSCVALSLFVGFMLLPYGCHSSYCPLIPMLDFVINPPVLI